MDTRLAVKPLDARRRPEDDMHPSHVSHPSFTRSSPLIVGIRVGETLQMLLLVFILRCPGRRIPLTPEGLDKKIPVSIRSQLEKNIFFLGKDDIARHIEPLPVLLRKIFCLDLFRRLYGPDKKKNDEKTPYPFRTLHDPIPVEYLSLLTSLDEIVEFFLLF